MGSIALRLRAWIGCCVHSVLLKALALVLNQGHNMLKARIHRMVCWGGVWVLAHVVCRMGSALWWGWFRGRLLGVPVQ